MLVIGARLSNEDLSARKLGDLRNRWSRRTCDDDLVDGTNGRSGKIYSLLPPGGDCEARGGNVSAAGRESCTAIVKHDTRRETRNPLSGSTCAP
jgi:hypothetical protein